MLLERGGCVSINSRGNSPGFQHQLCLVVGRSVHAAFLLLDEPEDAVSVAASVFGASARSVLESCVIDQPAEKEIET